jgi:Zn-dependent M16 (insulinase) family peptidase
VSTKGQEEIVVGKLQQLITKFNARSNLDRTLHPSILAFHEQMANEQAIFVDTPTQSNNCATATICVPYTDPRNPHLGELADVFSHEYLHKMLRVAMGVYGSWGTYSSTTAVFGMSTFRDQNVSGCMEVFRKALDMAAEGDGLTDEIVDRMVVRYFSDLDKPEAPQKRGLMGWQYNIPKEYMEKRRELFYTVKKEDLMEAAKWLKGRVWKRVAVSNETLAKAPEGFTVIKPFGAAGQ